MQNYSLTNKYVSPPMNISNCLVTYKYASTFFIPPGNLSSITRMLENTAVTFQKNLSYEAM